MNKALKYILITLAALVVLCFAAILIIPQVITVSDYKPQIEQMVTEKTGFPLVLGGDVDLSLFPWVGLRFTDLQLNNPAGFDEEQFVRIEGFQARLKFIPLLSRRVEVDRFIVQEPAIMLERNKQGSWNFQKPGAQATGGEASADRPEPLPEQPGQPELPGPPGSEAGGIALESLVVGEFAIENGTVVIVDRPNGSRRVLSEVNLTMTDISLEEPISLDFEARLDGEPLGVTGSIGPLGSDPASSSIDLDLLVHAFGTLSLKASGTVANLLQTPGYNLQLVAEPFNLKRLLTAAGVGGLPETADPEAMTRVGVQATLHGNPTRLKLTDTRVTLDDSIITLEAEARDFSRPDVSLDLDIDTVDIDRYLPPPAPPAENKGGETASVQANGEAPTAPAAGAAAAASSPAAGPSQETAVQAAAAAAPDKKAAPNYEPLRRLILAATVDIGSCKIHGGRLDNISVDVNASNGLFTITSLGLNLYEGSIVTTGNISFQDDIPATALNLGLEGVQVGPLLRDFAQKDILEGLSQAEISLNFTGVDGDTIKRSLNGGGTLLFQDGALIGLDLALLARQIASGFTFDAQGQRPRTDFAELRLPFTLENGVANTPEASLKSPFIRVTARGSADLVGEALDLRLNPKLVGSIKGQGDEEERQGIAVPIIVGGTFSAPSFRPDLEALATDTILENIDEKELSKIIESGEITPERKQQLSEEVEKAKGLLKGLFGN